MKERNDEQNIESNGGADRKLLIKIKSTYRDVGAFLLYYKLLNDKRFIVWQRNTGEFKERRTSRRQNIFLYLPYLLIHQKALCQVLF